MNDAQYDAQLNINTEIYYESYSRSNIHRYEPTYYRHLEQLFQAIAHKIQTDDVLIDIGSGMHRVPIYATDYFGIKTKGVEINKQLYMSALKNIKQYNTIKQCQIEAYNCDILKYIIKQEDTIFFFFNPFSINVFRTFINMLLKENKKRCIIILYYPDDAYISYLRDLNVFQCTMVIELEHYYKDEREQILIFEI